MRTRELLNFESERVLHLGRAIAIVWKSGPWWTVARSSITIVKSCIPITRLYIMKLLLDTITMGFDSDDPQDAFRRITPLVIAMGLVNLASALLTSVSRLVNQYQEQVVSDRLYEIIHDKAIAVDLEHYENPAYYDILERARNQANSVPLQLLNRLEQIGGNLVQLATMGTTLLSFNWLIGGVLVIPVIPRILVRLAFVREIHAWLQRRTSTQREASYYNSLLVSENYAKEIRLFQLGELFSRRFRKLRWRLREERLQIALRRASADFFTTLISVIATWGIYAYIAYQTVQGNITVGDLVLYNQAFRKAYDALWQVLQGVAGLYDDNRYLSYLFEFLNIKPKIVDPEFPKPVPRPMQQGICFNNVYFNYPNSQREAIKNASLHLGPGEVIALVGENGSGKTTLIKLLCRLYEPTEGSVEIDGIDVRDMKVRELRQQISVIFQDYAKYHLTARENIWLGNLECPSDDERIIKAAQRSGADEVIQTLPLAYDNLLGKRFETGEELSIGQWQKVSIARAFLRDSQVIVLDEPTSALDPKAEYEVFKKFRELLEGQSAVLITHRLSTVKMADRIYVLDKGRIVECGSHDELIAMQGLYATLFETQARNYR
ncbi:ABC transporter ATP-binding protein/permease [Phormidium yuhuli AB48]|uniref:ABC transporter ATP-binding protein/permease n=1 Tax=Phormidium yuhuli AB48 TaxID=2940671 RepID=A0ABY5APX1_9CYAN|nr:ABC transporter ATP-binding protein [Phormidium yuhuli]USR90294.1 ABC transporter ATP-binding protein/permease [Phormidium yuhuli AB48]